jgi:drug/metabolite transporter (DMT)-like permease
MILLLGIALMFLTIFLYSISNVIESYQSNNLFSQTSIFVFISKAFGILILPIFLFFPPTVPDNYTLLLIFATSFLEVAYQMPYYLALRNIDTTAVVALFSIKRAIIPFLAFYFLGEVLTTQQYIGFVFIVFTSFVISFDPNSKGLRLNKGFYWMTLASAMLALQSLLYKFNFEQGLSVLNLLFWSTTIELFLSFALLLVTGGHRELVKKLYILRQNGKSFILNEFLNQTGNILSLFALKILPVSIVEAMYSLTGVFVILAKKIPLIKNSNLLDGEVKMISDKKLTYSLITIVLGVFLVLV